MTTPEQVTKWLEDADYAYYATGAGFREGLIKKSFIARYLRAKQESEQAMKLAKFGAMVAKSHADGDFIESDALTTALLASGCAVEPVKGKIDYAPNIEATIKELLARKS